MTASGGVVLVGPPWGVMGAGLWDQFQLERVEAQERRQPRTAAQQSTWPTMHTAGDKAYRRTRAFQHS